LPENGKIYAFDKWEEGIDELKKRIANKSIKNIITAVAEGSKKLPLADKSIDVCLLATVFHDLVQDGVHQGTLAEIDRTLKPTGKLAIIEFKKVEGPPGPPFQVRISPAELEEIINPFGFRITVTSEIGPYNYLSIFTHQEIVRLVSF